MTTFPVSVTTMTAAAMYGPPQRRAAE
jgi:hypothetical protein